MMRLRQAAAVSVALLAAVRAGALPGRWTIEAETSPLTNLAFVSGTLASSRPLTSMIGTPSEARLVLRCRDRVVAAYVVWPEVVAQNFSNLMGQPKSQAFWKVDEGAIQSGLWDVSEAGTGAGAFTTAAALRLITPWRRASRLVVRLSGRTTQDAVFDLDGIEDVAAQVLTACGASSSAAPASPGATGAPAPTFSAGIAVAVTESTSVLLSSARNRLEGLGFEIVASEPQDGVIMTEAREVAVTSKQADCGRSLGIPFLADRRAHPTVAYRVTIVPGKMTVQAAVGGVYKVGMGVSDRQLRCTSKGLLESQLAARISEPPAK